MNKSRHRKRQDRRSRRATTTRTREKHNPTAERRAEKSAARLLAAAERQAKRGYPRLIAEIFRFLRPTKLTILQVPGPKKATHN